MPILDIMGINYLSDYARYNNPSIAGYYKPSTLKKISDYFNSNNKYTKEYDWKNYLNSKKYNQSELTYDLEFREKRIGRKFDNIYHTVPDTSNTFFKGRRLLFCIIAVYFINSFATKKINIFTKNSFVDYFYFSTHYFRYTFNSVLTYYLYNLCDETI